MLLYNLPSLTLTDSVDRNAMSTSIMTTQTIMIMTLLTTMPVSAAEVSPMTIHAVTSVTSMNAAQSSIGIRSTKPGITSPVSLLQVPAFIVIKTSKTIIAATTTARARKRKYLSESASSIHWNAC